MGVLHTKVRSDQSISNHRRVLAGFTAATLAIGGLSLSPLFTEVAEAAATVGTLYDTGGWRSGAPLNVYMAAGRYGTSGNSVPKPFAPIDDQTLYGSTYLYGGTVFTYARGGADPTPNGQVEIGYGHNVINLQSNPLSTIAIDADPDGVRNAKYAYMWGWNTTNFIDSSEANSLGMTNWSNLPNGYAPIFRATEGESTLDILMVPTPTTFPDRKSIFQYWSAGEVIQGTGEIFFGGGECTVIGDGYRMMILDPVTGKYNYSGKLVPKTPDDNIFHSTGTNCGENGYVASDFALDANGNAYLTVASNEKSDAFGLRAANRMWIVRVVPSETGDWVYNLVTPLTAAPGQSDRVTNYVARGVENYDYGQAFYNGKMYVTEYRYRALLEIDPVSGQVYNLPHGRSNPPPSGPVEDYVQDLASGQTAIVIQGNVYNDLDGNGVIAGDALAPGQTVALYSKAADGTLTYQGQRTTDPSGEYSFLVSSLGEWVVRLVQPTLDSRNAVQTWASAGGVKNPTVAKCDSGDLTSPGACSGALASPHAPDPALPTADNAPGTDTSTQAADMAVYTSVTITSSTEVVNADFGITTAGDYGDSPLGPATVADGAPFHLNSVDPQLWLGSTVGVTAGPSTSDTDASDDGVAVSTYFGDQPLGGTVISASHEYTLNATVSGPKAAQANISGWISPGGSWVATPAWSPTLTGATASGPFTYQTIGPVAVGATGYLRVDASAVVDLAPTNPPGSYTVYPGSANWAVPGEIEDYTVTLAPAAYRPAAVTTGPSGTFTVGGQSLTADTTVVLGASAAATLGSNTITASVPDSSWTVNKIEALSLETGALIDAIPFTTSGLDYTFSRIFAAGEDVVILVTFQQGPHPDLSALTVDKNTTPVGTPITATATIKDASGAHLDGVEVLFKTLSPEVILSSDTCVTDVTGTCSVTTTSHTAGFYPDELSAHVKVAGFHTEISNSPQHHEFTAGPVDPDHSSLTVDPLTQIAGSPIVATVTAHDAHDNPVTGLNASQVVVDGVSKTAGVPDSSLEVTGFVEVGNGVYTYSLTSKLVAEFTLSATVDSVLLNEHPVISFTAGGVCVANCTPVDPTHVTRVVMDVNDQLANGIDKDTAIAYAYDQYGNAVPGASVVVTDESTGALAGKISPSNQMKTTGADGTATLSWTSLTAGSFTAESTIDGLKPTIGGVLSGANGIRFTNGSADPNRSTLVVTPAGPLVAGESYTALVTILDATDNPVASETVSFTTNSPNATVSEATCATNTAGQCTVTFSSKLVGTYELSAKVSVAGTQTNVSGSPAAREFIAGTVCVVNCDPVDPANVTRVVVTKNGAEANGTDQDQATVYAYDYFGNPVPGAAVATTTSDSSLNALNPTATTGADGTAVLSYTSNSVGVKSADVTVDSKTPSGSPISLTFGAGVPDPGHSSVTISPLTPQVVDSVFTITAHVADAADNAVEDAVVTFSTTAPAVLSDLTCTTDATGTCSVTLTSAKVGTYEVHATLPNHAGIPTDVQNSPVSATFTAGEVCTQADGCTADPGEPLTRVEIIHNGAANDGVEHDIVRVYAYDKHGNPVPGATVTSTKNPGVDLIIQPSIAPTGTDGTTTIWYASNTAGIHLADVRVDSKTPAGSPVSLAFGSGLGDPDSSSFLVSPAGPLVVGQDAVNTYTATATVNDFFGYPAAGVVVTFEILPNTGPTWVGGSSSCITIADGTCSASVYSTKSGTFTITASLATGAIRVGTSPLANPVYGVSRAWKADEVCSAAAGCTPVDPNLPSELRTRVEVTLDNQLADGNAYDEATLYAFDKWGNPVPAALVKSATADATLYIQPGIPGTNDDGESVIKYASIVAGAHLATVEVDSKNVPGSPITLNFRPGSPDPTQSALSVSPTTQEAGKEVTATAVIKDSKGNVIAGTPVTFGVSGNAELSAPTATTNASGQGVVTLTDKKAETVSVTATIKVGTNDVAISGSPASVVFTAGVICIEPCVPDPEVPNDRRTRVEVTVDDMLADGVSADVATAWAFDKFGNPVPNATATTTKTAANLTIKTASSLTDNDGSALLSYTSTVAGAYQASVFLNGVEIIFTPQPGSALDNPAGKASKSSPITVTFLVGEPDPNNSTLVVSPTTQTAGENVTVTVTVRDATNNTLAGAAVYLASTGSSTLGAITGVTNSVGVFTTTLTDKKAETVEVSAKVEVLGVQTPVSGSPASVTFVPGPICMEPDCEPDPEVPNDRRTRVEVTANNALANDIHANTTTTWAFDKYGNAVIGATAHTSSPSATLRIPITHKLVLDTGSIEHDFHSQQAGDHLAHVFIDGKQVIFTPQPGSDLDNPVDKALRSSPATLTFKAGVVDATHSTLVVDPTTQEVGENVDVTVTVRDVYDNPISGVTVTLGTTGDSVLGVTTGVTNAAGQVVTTLTDKKAETVSVTATVPVNGVQTDVSGSPAEVVFTPGVICIDPCEPDPGVPNDRRTRIDVVVDGSLADGKATDEVVAWAFDKYGNPLKDIFVESTSLAAVLRVEEVTTLTGLDGSASITYSATAGGSHQASVKLSGYEVIFTPQPGSAWDNPTDKAAHSSPATLTFKTVVPKADTGGWVLSLAPPVRAFAR